MPDVSPSPSARREYSAHRALMTATMTAIVLAMTACLTPPPQATPCKGAQPSRRVLATAAYDPSRKVVVLFGGGEVVLASPASTRTLLADTWEWSEGCWSQKTSAEGPSARLGAAMAADPAGGILLFGGQTSTGYAAGTWRWDGRAWRQVASAESGPPDGGWRMATDPVHHTVVLIGLAAGLAEGALQTWTWQSDRWTHRALPGPPLGGFVGPAFDPVTRSVILMQPRVPADVRAPVPGMWAWNGDSWRQVPFAGDARAYALGAPSMASIASPPGVLMVGTGGTALWDGKGWSILKPTHEPTEASEGVNGSPSEFSFASTDAGAMLFGGRLLNLAYNSTWTWTGSDWRRVQASTAEAGPSGRCGAGQVSLSYGISYAPPGSPRPGFVPSSASWIPGHTAYFVLTPTLQRGTCNLDDDIVLTLQDAAGNLLQVDGNPAKLHVKGALSLQQPGFRATFLLSEECVGGNQGFHYTVAIGDYTATAEESSSPACRGVAPARLTALPLTRVKG